MIDISNQQVIHRINPQGEQTPVMFPMNEFFDLVEDLISIGSRKNEPAMAHENG